MKRVLACPECGGSMILRRSDAPNPFYGCENFPRCRCVHLAHARSGEPVGVPADAPTRLARKETHKLFDELWKSGKCGRTQAYRLLADLLGIPESKAHIGSFSMQQCARLVAILSRLREEDWLPLVRMPFGEHFGKQLREIDRSVLQHMANDRHVHDPARWQIAAYLLITGTEPALCGGHQTRMQTGTLKKLETVAIGCDETRTRL